MAVKAIWSSVSLAMGLLLAEGVVRWLRLGPEFYELPVEAFRPSDRPGLDYEFRPLARFADGHINAAGMRDRSRSPGKTDGVYRIACVGDSICAGLNVSDTQTFCRVWEDSSTGGARPVEVLNFGVPGYNVDNVMAMLRERVTQYNPDMVVYAYCLNDVQSLSFEKEALLAHPPSFRPELWIQAKRPFVSWLNRSRLYVLARYGAIRLLTRRNAAPTALPEENPQMLAWARAGNAAYFDALYTQTNRDKFQAAMRAYAQSAMDHRFIPVLAIFPIRPAAHDYPLSTLHAFLGETARAEGVFVVDLQETLSRADWYADALHLTPEGHRLVAAALQRAAGEVVSNTTLQADQ